MFIVNNDGYSSIRNSQKNFFSGYHVGASRDSGVSFPAIDDVAKAFKIPYVACNQNNMKYYYWSEIKSNRQKYYDLFKTYDVGVVASFGHLIPSHFIQLFP